MLYPNPSFAFTLNSAVDRGFIVSPRGSSSVVNADAFDLLTDTTGRWQARAEHAAFFAKAAEVGWLVADDRGAASVRRVNAPVHLRRVQYEVNLHCNLECQHCYCSSSPTAPRGESTEFVLDVVAQAAAMGVLHFDVTGGEPLMRRDVVEIVRAIRRAGMVPSIFSNCTLMTPELIAELVDAGIAAVQTSLDARTPALHDEIRGQTGAFDKAVRGIRLLQAARVPVSVTVCLNRRNMHEIESIVAFLRDDLGVPYRLDRVIPTGRTLEHGDRLALDNAEYYGLIQRYFGTSAARVAKKVCDSVNIAAEGGAIEPHCGVGASYMFIKHDGRAALCPTMTEAESPDFAQADLKTLRLAEAWERHPTFQRFRGVQCENTPVCPSGNACRGGCRSNAYLLYGRVDSPDEMHCNIQKNRAPDYRPMIAEYEEMRRSGALPPRRADAPVARHVGRSLPVLA